MEKKDLDVLLKEKRVFKPSKGIVEDSNIKKWMDEHNIKSYNELLEKAEDHRWFWEEMAKELEWYKPWDDVLEWNPPDAKWFIGAKCNIVHNALDRHMKTGVREKIAYIWESEDGRLRRLTYEDLYKEVNRFANALKRLGVKKGDRVSIYLPMIPELPIAMLACARIGAIHSVVFSGFSAKAFAQRVNDAGAKIAITVDGFYRRGGVVPLKESADEAIQNAPAVERLIVVKHAGNEVAMKDRDMWWHELVKNESTECETEVMDSEDPLFILYTSGTTGKPKGVVHVHGGYSVGVYTTLKYVFDLRGGDVWWCTADVGWVTGHSYIVYAPLMAGATSVMYEGAPDYPAQDRMWEIVERYKVTIFYTAPTLIRMFMKFGDEWLKKHDISSLRLLGSVGEPINPEAWVWYHQMIGGGRCPIMDTWWQTETGNFMISPYPVTPLKPGSATKPLPGIEADIYNEDGKSITNKGGYLVIKKPWPSMIRTVYGDPDRYHKQYWSMFPGVYLTGDMARRDEEGYFWIQGRSDDVLKVAGHRIGSAEVESALVSHPAVAEAAVVGKPDPIKGEAIEALVILKRGVNSSPELKEELRIHVGKELGAIAKPSTVKFVNDLPKTRSGKIMRRVIKAKVLGEDVGDISTLANPEAVEELDRAV
ncbi:MAG: acetate--CoA ligase [Candidatus Altiarchaeota archaeon]|nr:acetate--CoA ligase [Candidatus Altiarchaeota archaeon]